MICHVRITKGDDLVWENPRATLPDEIRDVGAYFSRAFGERVILHAEKNGFPNLRHYSQFRGESTIEGYRVTVVGLAKSHYGAGAHYKPLDTPYTITAEKWI